MNAYKDGFERGIVVVNSAQCLEEMKRIQREENGDIAAPGRGKDDRVIASGLSTVAWHDFFRIRLAQAGITRAKAEARSEDARPVSAVERNVMDYLRAIGVSAGDAVH